MTTQFKFNGSPIAQSFNEMRTPKQLALLSRMSRYEGKDVDSECRRLLGCEVAQLSRRGASALIDWLKKEGNK